MLGNSITIHAALLSLEDDWEELQLKTRKILVAKENDINKKIFDGNSKINLRTPISEFDQDI